MNWSSRTLSSLLLAASALTWSGTTYATWIGLADGDYDVTLTSCSSSIDPGICAAIPVNGSISVSGSGVSFLSFVFDGVSFVDDPFDFVTNFSVITPGDFRERSRVSHPVPTFEFFELMSAIGPVLPTEVNLWIYCRDNPVANSCALIASGAWVATLRAVPEPTTWLLLALGLAGLSFARRRQFSLISVK